MVSTERVLAYSRLEPEASLESTPLSKPPPDWPKHGHIEMNDVCYRHSSDGQLVLKGISLNIHSGEKVSIAYRITTTKNACVSRPNVFISMSILLTSKVPCWIIQLPMTIYIYQHFFTFLFQLYSFIEFN